MKQIIAMKNIIAYALTLLIVACPCMAKDDDKIMNEYVVKAAFIYNFAKFVEWPPCREYGCSEFKLVLGIYGWENLSDRVGKAFNAINGKTVGNKVISVRYISDPARLMHCQMVYLFSSNETKGKILADRLKGRPILTVSNEETFVHSGGMIELLKVGDKLRFSINRSAAKDASIHIRSQLLKLAREVVE